MRMQPGALAVDWQVVNVSPEKHGAYAVQWFTMAAVLLMFYVLRSSNMWQLLRAPENRRLNGKHDRHRYPATMRNRMVLLLIAGIPVTMILAATWLWYFVVRGDLDLVGALGTANRGSLVQPPRQLDEPAPAVSRTARFQLSADLEPSWTMLVPGARRGCDAACEHSLYLTRQIHVAMGKEFNRGAPPVCQ